jgi:hypothetical protein
MVSALRKLLRAFLPDFAKYRTNVLTLKPL